MCQLLFAFFAMRTREKIYVTYSPAYASLIGGGLLAALG